MKQSYRFAIWSLQRMSSIKITCCGLSTKEAVLFFLILIDSICISVPMEWKHAPCLFEHFQSTVRTSFVIFCFSHPNKSNQFKSKHQFHLDHNSTPTFDYCVIMLYVIVNLITIWLETVQIQTLPIHWNFGMPVIN